LAAERPSKTGTFSLFEMSDAIVESDILSAFRDIAIMSLVETFKA
jgi:hypothetical protein